MVMKKNNPELFLRNKNGEFIMPRDHSRMGGVNDYYEETFPYVLSKDGHPSERSYFMEQNLHEGRPGIKVGAIALGKVQIWSPAWVEVFFGDDTEVARLDVINPEDINHYVGKFDANPYAGSIALHYGESVVIGRELYPDLHKSTSNTHVRLEYTAREGCTSIKGINITDLSRYGTQVLEVPKNY